MMGCADASIYHTYIRVHVQSVNDRELCAHSMTHLVHVYSMSAIVRLLLLNDGVKAC